MKRISGFTLIELVLAITLVVLVITVGTNILIFGMRTQEATIDQFDMQSNVRLMTLKVNNAVRNASGLFLLDKAYPDGSIAIEDYFTEGWNYMMMNGDKTALVEWVWNGTNHVERSVVGALDGVTFDLVYDKHEAANVNNLLEYTLSIHSGTGTKQIVSELESLNTLQVMDRSYAGIPNTLAYREDPRVADVGVAQAAVSFVVDKSGSMDWRMDGSSYTNNSSTNVFYHSRMKILKTEATKMIQGLADNENVFLSISPFSYTANSTTGDNLNQMMALKSNLTTFIGTGSIINNLDPSGNTNTADGMRRGFKTIESFNALEDNKDKTTKNFMIILVDGETNRASLYENVTNHYITSYNNPAAHRVDVGGTFYDFTSWYDPLGGTNKFTYTNVSGSGTITVNDDPIYHTIENSGKDYEFDDWSDYYNEFYYDYVGPTGYNFVTNDQNIEKIFDIHSGSFQNNQFYANGAVPGNSTANGLYVDEIGELIKGYKNTRLDGITTYVIGFSSDATPTGLTRIAKAVGSTNGTKDAGLVDGVMCKYYVAETDAALAAVLAEIKFQISEALWHIGGPN